VIIHQSTKPGESGLLDDSARQILRYAQDDKPDPSHIRSPEAFSPNI
jgi:hypothetical protein